jgi:hypothetical protein
MKRRHSMRGASLAESTVVMIAFLMLLAAVIDFGRYLYTYTFLADVAQRGSRWAIVRGANCTRLDHCGVTTQNEYVVQYMDTLTYGIVNPAQLDVAADIDGVNRGGLIVIYVSYPFHFITPWFPAGTITMHNAARMHVTN